MKKNVGTADQIIRVVIAAIAAGLIIFKALTGTWAIVVGIVGVVMLITAVTGFCGLYKVFGMSTCPAKPKE
mgnify:FL=1